MNKKATGAYYTPLYLAKFIVDRVISNFTKNNKVSILEPSVGDGVFLEALNDKCLNYKLTAVEINNDELKKAKGKCTSNNTKFLNKDFLDYKPKNKYDLVIGNPPYVKKTRLKKKQIEAANKIFVKEGILKSKFKNLWAAFLIKSVTLLKDDGILAFVLPTDLLQVKFADEIKSYLKNQFKKLEIFTFNNLMFNCKYQDTVVLFAYKKADNKGIYYSNIKSTLQLAEKKFSLKKNTVLVKSNIKWIHHCLTNSEISFLNKLQKSLYKINYYCNSKPGIVTGANNFFVINDDAVKSFKLEKFVLPIIQKGVFVNGRVTFDEVDYKDLCSSSKPTKLLSLKDNDFITKSLKQYLKIGIDQKLQERYKCRIRKNWFVVPNVSIPSDGFFFKRSHKYPKLIKNNAKILVTDAAYKVNMNSDYDINSLIYSFYNSLTLVFAELKGRYYGGGVLELTPSEFQNLPIPYHKISENLFNKYAKNFKVKNNIEAMFKKYDLKLLSKAIDISERDISRIHNIRKKLISKRIRK